MNKKFEYIKEASPFGSLRQILRILPPDVREYDYHGGFDSRGYELAKQKYEKEIAGNPLYPLSTQPSEQWIERKEYQEGVDFKFSYEEIINDPLYHTASIIQSNHPLSAIPIEKKDDLVASQNHPQPLDSVATLACTEGNSIEQEAASMLPTSMSETSNEQAAAFRAQHYEKKGEKAAYTKGYKDAMIIADSNAAANKEACELAFQK
jgi:hypothetical protein